MNATADNRYYQVRIMEHDGDISYAHHHSGPAKCNSIESAERLAHTLIEAGGAVNAKRVDIVEVRESLVSNLLAND